MAKFKKKQSEPIRGENEVEKTPPLEQTLPPVEEPKVEITQTPPTADPPADIAQQGEKKRKLNQLFWMRVIVAIIAGISATVLFDSVEGEERRWSSIVYMIVIFAATIIFAKTMNIPFALSDRKKLYTQGIGSYVFIYLFMWIFSYTLANLDNSSVSIPFS